LGNVTLKNVLLKPDTQVYARMEAAELAQDSRYDIEIKELKIKRFGILNMLSNRELHIKSIDLAEPRMYLTNKYHAYNDTIATEKPKKSLYESIKGVLNAVNIGRIDIERAAFRLTKLNEDSVSTNFGLDSLQIRAEDILIDEHAQADTSRLYYTKLIEAFIPGFEYTFSDGFYKARFEALQINTQAQTLLLTQVDFRPALDKAAFYKKHGKNVTRADLHFDTLYMEKLDFKKLIEEQQTIA